MFTLIEKFTVVVMLLALTAGSPAALAQTKQQKKAAKVEEKLKKLGTGEKAKVRVKLYNQTIYQGYLSEVGDDDFVVVDKGGNPNRLRYADVEKIGGQNLSTGAKVAIGIGIGIGALILLGLIAATQWGD